MFFFYFFFFHPTTQKTLNYRLFFVSYTINSNHRIPFLCTDTLNRRIIWTLLRCLMKLPQYNKQIIEFNEIHRQLAIVRAMYTAHVTGGWYSFTEYFEAIINGKTEWFSQIRWGISIELFESYKIRIIVNNLLIYNLHEILSCNTYRYNKAVKILIDIDIIFFINIMLITYITEAKINEGKLTIFKKIKIKVKCSTRKCIRNEAWIMIMISNASESVISQCNESDKLMTCDENWLVFSSCISLHKCKQQ